MIPSCVNLYMICTFCLYGIKFLACLALPSFPSFTFTRVMGHSLVHPPYREPDHPRSIVYISRSVSHYVLEADSNPLSTTWVNRALLSGFFSWRNPDVGSWFIQALCEELDLHGRKRDLLSLMTSVNRRVAIEYQSYVPQNEKFHGKKQIPSIVSMLTRLVYFPDKCAPIPDDPDDVSGEKKSQVCKKVT